MNFSPPSYSLMSREYDGGFVFYPIKNKRDVKMMSEIMQARREMLKKLNVMVRKIEEVSTFVLAGEKGCPPYEIYLVTAAAKAEDTEKIYADFNFLVGEFLMPQTHDKEENEGRTVAKYRFESGLFLETFICPEDNLPPFDWWVPYVDKNEAAAHFYLAEGKMPEDPTSDIPEESSSTAPAAAVPEPVVEIPVAEPTAAVPEVVWEAAVPVAVPEQQKEKTPELSWEMVYNKMNLAKHAIAGGSVIYAGEIINELRTWLIRLICEKNGITEDYAHSIDLLSNEYQKALVKTYPTKPESGAMVAALAAELSLFEKLMN